MKGNPVKALRKIQVWLLLAALCLSLTPLGALAEAAPVDETTQNGYRETTEGYTTEVAWVANGEENIFGKFYYPLDFDPEKQYPVIIMSHGVSVTHTIFEKGKWVDFATANGCVAYAFDFCGSSERALSSMDMDDMTIHTQISDLNAVIDFVKAQPFVNRDYIFLMGQSFGGLISAITAPDRDSEIRAMILLYPAISVVDTVHEMFPTVKDIPKEGAKAFDVEHPKAYFKAIWNLDLEGTMKRFNGKVLLIHGEMDQAVPLSYSEYAVRDIYEEGQAELLTITGKGSVHAFEVFNKEGRAAAQEKAKAFLEAQLAPYRTIACIGDSITYGMMRNGKGEYTQFDNYPHKLEKLLGEGWKVCNYGQPGAYVTKDDGKLCYWNLKQFAESKAKAADAYIIMLGTNDSSDWRRDEYEKSLSELLDAYRESAPESKIFLMLPPTPYPNPLTGEINSGVSAEILATEVPAIVTAIAAEKGIQVLDLHTLTADHPDWFADGLHPNGEGHQHIADYIYEQIRDSL